jgi:ABC-2 type transport system ATP-binding protein
MVDFANGENKLFTVQSVDKNSPAKEIFDMCANNNWYITQMIPQETKLEDIFRKLTMN